MEPREGTEEIDLLLKDFEQIFKFEYLLNVPITYYISQGYVGSGSKGLQP